MITSPFASLTLFRRDGVITMRDRVLLETSPLNA